jgi:hypothetical protein
VPTGNMHTGGRHPSLGTLAVINFVLNGWLVQPVFCSCHDSVCGYINEKTLPSIV